MTPYDHEPLTNNNEAVDIVEGYKYLGMTVDDKFTFNQNSEKFTKKVTQECISSDDSRN